ncbi:MAG: ankyrin repeat domain-containing protein [Luteimonas sp.]
MPRIAPFLLLLLAPFAGFAQQVAFDRADKAALELAGAYYEKDMCSPLGPQPKLKRALRESLADIHEAGFADITGLTPVDFAVWSDDTAAVRRMMDLGYPLTSAHRNVLHGAVQMSSLEMIRFIVANGVDPNAPTGAGATPLMAAAAENRLDVVRELVAAGARVDVREQHGGTALHYAMVCHDQAMIDFLVEAGAPVDKRALRLAAKFHVRLAGR